jgi:hypothetical protein
MKGFRKKGRLVLPVFYGVDPSDLRHQKGSYSLAERVKKFQNNEKNMKRLYQWKKALTRAANIAGYHFKTGYPSFIHSFFPIFYIYMIH